MRGIEVGDAEVADPASLAQGRQLLHRVEIARVLEGPPVKLQQVDRFDPEPRPCTLDALSHDLARHRSRRRAPFGERDGAARARRLACGDALEKPARDDFRAAVVIGHVESIEARAGVFEHRARGDLRNERSRALLVRDLPKPGDDAADLEAGGEHSAFGCQHRCPHSSRWRETIVRSPIRPRGRSNKASARKTPIATICKDEARACWSGGKTAPIAAPEALHSAQTRTPPSIAPLLLPEPPRISIVQTKNVRLER